MEKYSVALVEDDNDLADMLPRSYRLYGNGSLDPEFDKISKTRDNLSTNPDEALEQLKSNHELIVLDNNLPWDWEGAELLYAAADRDLSTDVILYTNALDHRGNNFDRERVKSIEKQNDELHYIRKDGEKLADLIDEVLGEEGSQTPQT